MKQVCSLLTLIIVLGSCSSKLADKNYDRGDFDRAITLYKKGYKEDDAEQNYKIAEAYRKSNRIKDAAPYYAAAYKAGSDESSLVYYYAKSLTANKAYDEARKVLNDYVTRPSTDEKMKQLAERELENLGQISGIEAQTNYYRVKNLEDLNTSNAEYAPVYSNGNLYFTSNREGGRIYGVTGTAFTDLYEVKTKGANVEIETLKPLETLINAPDINEGTMAVSSDGMSFIFAKGNTGKASGNNEVNLYFTRYRNGTWLEPRPIEINMPDYWDSSPAFTPDGRTLYFASNREGGFGGADIYSAQLNRRGRWVDVQNLGPEINTPGDEMFPFISEDGHLYFASNGHPGFGNLDLFMATRVRGKITIENLGQPMNSSSDDFALFQYDLTRGFFSSNRPGGKGDDDIYTYVNDDPDLKVVNYFLVGTTHTYDDANQVILLPNTKVTLQSANGDIVDQTYTSTDGKFKFRVYPEENYDLIGEKTDYFSTRKAFSTVDKSVDRATLTEMVTNITFETQIVMERIVLEKTIVLNNIYYDLDKADIRPDAAVVLDSLVQIMNDNPGIYIELGSHTDSRAPDDYNMELSQRRAKSAVDYIIAHGIDSKRIVAKGYGETHLLIPNATTEEQHQKNRRTEFKVLRYIPKNDDGDEVATTPETTPQKGNNPATPAEEQAAPPKKQVDEYDRFFDDDGDGM